MCQKVHRLKKKKKASATSNTQSYPLCQPLVKKAAAKKAPLHETWVKSRIVQANVSFHFRAYQTVQVVTYCEKFGLNTVTLPVMGK